MLFQVKLSKLFAFTSFFLGILITVIYGKISIWLGIVIGIWNIIWLKKTVSQKIVSFRYLNPKLGECDFVLEKMDKPIYCQLGYFFLSKYLIILYLRDLQQKQKYKIAIFRDSLPKFAWQQLRFVLGNF